MPDVTNQPPKHSQKGTFKPDTKAAPSEKVTFADQTGFAQAQASLKSPGIHGLKNAFQVTAFMNSGAGKALKAEIERTISEQEAHAAHRQTHQQEKVQLRRRAFASLLAGYRSRKSAAAERYAQVIEKANKLAVERAALTHTPLYFPQHQEVTRYDVRGQDITRIDGYFQELLVISGEIEQQLSETLLHYEAEQQLIEARYQLFEESADSMDAILDSLSDVKQIERHIDVLRREMEQQTETIQSLIVEDRDAEAMQLRDVHNSLHVQMACLKDALAVLNNTKYFVNANGERVNSFRQAAFVISSDDHIVEHQGKHYLLRKTMSWDAVKDSQEALHAAEQRYARLQPELMPVKRLIQHNRGLETEFVRDRVAVARAELEAQQAVSGIIREQRNLLRSAITSSADTSEQDGSLTAPRPALTMSSTRKPEKDNEWLNTKDFRKAFRALKSIISENQPVVDNAGMTMRASPTARAKPMADALLSAIPGSVGGQAYLKYGRGTGNIDDKFPVHNNEPQPASAPTPFSIKPR